MSGREQAKSERRDRILAAAKELLLEMDWAGFTMRALAKRANLDVVTLYNLVGSKHAILHVLLEEDIRAFGQEVASSGADPLRLLFHAVSKLKEYYGREPRYYRSVLHAIYLDGGAEYPSISRGPRWVLWRDFVVQAEHQGYLSKDVNASALSIHLTSTLFVHILQWVAGDISLQEMEMRCHYSFALSLHTVVVPRHQKPIYELYLSSQKELEKPRGREPLRNVAAPAAGKRKQARKRSKA